VSYQHVTKAFEQLYASKNVQILWSLWLFEMMFVLTVFCKQMISANDRTAVEELYGQFKTFETQLNNPTKSDAIKRKPIYLTEIEFKEILLKMKTFGIISVSIEGQIAFVQLHVYIDEIKSAYEENEEYEMYFKEYV